MGYSTDFSGRIEIEPPLNEIEILEEVVNFKNSDSKVCFDYGFFV